MRKAQCDHKEIYGVLYELYGNLHWWPADSPDEVLIGSILTQNTSWKNVEKSISRLRESGMLSLELIAGADLKYLSEIIRSSGFYVQKAERLKLVSSAIIREYGGLPELAGHRMKEIENFLISLKGIGEETMESIMLYALDIPVFVVDSYALRIFSRLGWSHQNLRRETLKKEVSGQLNYSVEMLKNYHAMIVELAKDSCRKTPSCSSCPLNTKCNYFIDSSVP